MDDSPCLIDQSWSYYPRPAVYLTCLPGTNEEETPVLTRMRLVAAVAALLGLAAPALAWHHCGGYHIHYRASGPITAGGPAVVPGVATTPGFVTHGLVTQGLVMPGLVTNGLVTNGLVTNGLVTNGLVTQGLTTQGNTTPGLVTQGLGTQGAQGCVTSQDITQLRASIDSLKQEVARMRETNDKIYLELKQIRKGEKTDPPAALPTPTPTGPGKINTGGDLKDIGRDGRPSGSGVDLAALRRQVEQRQNAAAEVDLGTLRRQVEQRHAAQAVPRPAAPPVVVAGAR
jgi:hypothetical protein